MRIDNLKYFAVAGFFALLGPFHNAATAAELSAPNERFCKGLNAEYKAQLDGTTRLSNLQFRRGNDLNPITLSGPRGWNKFAANVCACKGFKELVDRAVEFIPSADVYTKVYSEFDDNGQYVTSDSLGHSSMYLDSVDCDSPDDLRKKEIADHVAVTAAATAARTADVPKAIPCTDVRCAETLGEIGAEVSIVFDRPLLIPGHTGEITLVPDLWMDLKTITSYARTFKPGDSLQFSGHQKIDLGGFTGDSIYAYFDSSIVERVYVFTGVFDGGLTLSQIQASANGLFHFAFAPLKGIH